MVQLDYDRPRGILTPADREFLYGDRELSEGAEFNTHRRIRKRVCNAILDFHEVFWRLDIHEIEKIAEEYIQMSDSIPVYSELFERLEKPIGLVDAVALFYIIFDDHKKFEDGIEEGILRALSRRTPNEVEGWDVDADIDIQQLPEVNPQQVAAKVDRGEISDLNCVEHQWMLSKLQEQGKLSADMFLAPDNDG